MAGADRAGPVPTKGPRLATRRQVTLSLGPGTHARLLQVREQLADAYDRPVTFSETIDRLIEHAKDIVPRRASAEAQ